LDGFFDTLRESPAIGVTIIRNIVKMTEKRLRRTCEKAIGEAVEKTRRELAACKEGESTAES